MVSRRSIFPPESNQPADRQARIGQTIRRWIISGKLSPGARLKSRQDLADQFDTTLMTIQKTISRLEQDGFVESRGWEGTFVSSTLPHLSRIAFLPANGQDVAGTWGFDQSLIHAAADITPPTRIQIYPGVRGQSRNEENLRHLILDIQRQCLAGMIVRDIYCLQFPALRQVLAQTNLPIVGILRSTSIEGMKRVSLNADRVIFMAVERLARMGKRKIAFISSINAAERFWGTFQQATSVSGGGAGLLAVPWRRFDVDLRYPASVLPGMHMLMRLPPADRPDAMLITDDNAVPLVTTALAQMSEQIGGRTSALIRDLAIVGLANFPVVTPSALPVMRLGFDSGAVLRACAELIFSSANRDSSLQQNAIDLEPRWQHEDQAAASLSSTLAPTLSSLH